MTNRERCRIRGPYLSRIAVTAVLGVAFLLGGCANLGGSPGSRVAGSSPASGQTAAPSAEPQGDDREARAAAADAASESALPEPETFPGSDAFIDRSVAGAERAAPARKEGEYTLNFEQTALREVVKVVLGEMLGENYVIDPRVNGQITLQTSQPLAEADLLPVLERLLRMNGAALVREPELYRVVPFAEAIQGTSPRLARRGQDLPVGAQVRIVPLRYIAAQQMKSILQPLAPPKAIIHVDNQRNLLMLAGTASELENLLATVSIFDVDWIAGMSIGLFPIEHAEATKVAGELKKVFGEGGQTPVSGLFKFIPVERINAILVVTPRSEYLEKARTWARRLDRGRSSGRMLHVYRVRNAKAEDLADVLSQIVEGQSQQRRRPDGPAQVAPGEEPAKVATEGAEGAAQAQAQAAAAQAARAQRASSPAGDETVSLADLGDVRIIADEANNALVVLATTQEYRAVEAAIRQLDVVPRQVLVEATIMEVSLTDDLQYGLQWFFKNRADDYDGRGTLSFSEGGALAASFPGFSYSLVDDIGDVRAVFNALKEKTNLHVLSSPSLMVLDNQSATIKVGDQVPVRTSESTSTASSGDNPIITSSIQYRDTGVLLTVNPRVNPGGLVIMEVEQEVNDVSSTTSSGIDSPTIQQRQIESTVAIQSGQTVVLGGLIRDNQSRDHSGVPILADLPGVGALFSQRSRNNRRTELVVLITPRVVAGAEEAGAVTEEFRNRLQGLQAWAAQRRADESESVQKTGD